MLLVPERPRRVGLKAAVVAMLTVPLFITVSRAQLVQTIDYSDTFTVAERGGIAERPDGSYMQGSPGYDVEDSHGNPTSTWMPFDHFSFSTGLNSTCCGYPTNEVNPGAASGVAQSGGDDYTFAYGLRTNYIVQLDSILPGDRLDIISVPNPGDSIFTPNSLSVFFRKSPLKIGLFNGSVETHISVDGQELETGITDSNWHNYAVNFNQDEGTIAIFVDDARIGVVDLTTFAGGAYLNYSNGAVGSGGTFVHWDDNFQVGKPAPTVACFTASVTGGLVPLAVDFNASCSLFSGSADTYNWTFGDTTSGSGVTVSHTYNAAGTYQVTLNVKDTNGSTSSASKTITVFEMTDSFHDDFQRADGLIDGWTVYSVPDTWNIASGKLTTGPTIEERWIWAGDPPFIFPERLVFEFDMQFVGLGTDAGVGRHGGGVFCASVPRQRGDAAFSGYFVDWIDRPSDHGVRLTRVDNAFFNAPILGGGGVDPPLKWRVEITGPNIRVYGDGTLYIDAIDSTYRGGFAGLWTWTGGEQPEYDNIALSVPTNPLSACFTTGGPQLPISGDTISFDAACTENVGAGTINSYAWSFGDTTTGSGAQLTHSFANPGVYTVSLKVKDSLGNESTATKTVTIFQRAVSFSDDFGRANGPVDGWTVYAPPDGWNILNGELTTGPTTRENWVWAGATPYVFPKNLTITWDQIYIAPGTDPVVGRHGGVAFCCNKPTHRYDADFNGYFVDWIDRATDHGPRLTRVDTGVLVELIRGVKDLPDITPDQEPPLVWRVELGGDHIRVFGDDVPFFDYVDGTYRGGLVGLWTYLGGQEVSYDNFNVTGEPLSACFASVPNLFPLTGSPVSFDGSCSEAFDSTIASYQWDFGDGATGAGATVQHAYSAAGVVTVKLTVKDALNRTASITHDLTVVDQPLLPFADCFDRTAGPVDGWTAALGDWNITADGAVETVTTTGEGFLYAGDPPRYLPTDFIGQVDWSLLGGTNLVVGRHAAVHFYWNIPTTDRFAADSRGYSVFYIDRTGDRGLTLARFDLGGGLTILNPPGGTPTVTEPPATLRIEVAGANISVFADGVKVIDVNDNTYRDGLFALWVWNSNTVQFDNVRLGVSELPTCEFIPPRARFVRGDANASGKIDLTDAITTLGYLYLGKQEPACFDAADADDNGKLELTDAVRVLKWLYNGGPAPPAPSPTAAVYGNTDCGTDPVTDPPDSLGCATFGPCL